MVPTWPPRSSRWVVLSLENEEVRFGDGFGLRSMSKEAFGGLPESFASSREAQSGLNDTNIGPIWVPGKPKVPEDWVKSNLIRRILCFFVREMHVGSFCISLTCVREGVGSECAATL